MPAVLAFLWSNKSWVLLAAVIIAAGLFIGALKIELSLKTAKINDQAAKITLQDAQIEALHRSVEVMNQNAVAARDAQTAMQKVLASSEKLKDLVNNLPVEVTKGLKNETMEKVNHCIGAFFRDGVLPEGCGDTATGTVLPKASNPKLE
jgi:outer membrane murein-binding lipoprotein Lpp